MGLFNWLFGKKPEEKQFVPRNLKAVKRLALKKGVSINSLDLQDESILEQLMLLGLIFDDTQGLRLPKMIFKLYRKSLV